MRTPPVVALTARTPRHWYILATLVVLWGTSFASSKIAVETISPLWVVALRISIGAVLMLAYLAYRRDRLSRTFQHWLWFLWLAVLGTVLPFTLISWGVRHIPSGVAGILMVDSGRRRRQPGARQRPASTLGVVRGDRRCDVLRAQRHHGPVDA